MDPKSGVVIVVGVLVALGALVALSGRGASAARVTAAASDGTPTCTGRDLKLSIRLASHTVGRAKSYYTLTPRGYCEFRRPGVPVRVSVRTTQGAIDPATVADQIPQSTTWGANAWGQTVAPGSQTLTMSSTRRLATWCGIGGGQRVTLTVSAPGAGSASVSEHLCS